MATRGWEHATPQDVRDRRIPTPSKYRNVKVVIDGKVFASKREGAEYQRLKARQHVGEIGNLRCQVPFALLAPVEAERGTSVIVAHYIADFTYTEVQTGERVVVDVKGKRTQMYLLKRKWLELQTGIQIHEV